MTKEFGNEFPENFDMMSNEPSTVQSTETCLFRYLLANHWTKGKDVLDVACGYGYGSAFMKILGAKSVTGFDLDLDAIAYAKKNYPFCNFDVKDISKPILEYENKFDVIVSIETFEHIARHEIGNYIDNLKRWLKPNGTVIITTPQKISMVWEFPRRPGIHSHLYEYSIEELFILMSNNFKGELGIMGIQEMFMGKRNQLLSVVTHNPREARILVVVIENVRK